MIAPGRIMFRLTLNHKYKVILIINVSTCEIICEASRTEHNWRKRKKEPWWNLTVCFFFTHKPCILGEKYLKYYWQYMSIYGISNGSRNENEFHSIHTCHSLSFFLPLYFVFWRACGNSENAAIPRIQIMFALHLNWQTYILQPLHKITREKRIETPSAFAYQIDLFSSHLYWSVYNILWNVIDLSKKEKIHTIFIQLMPEIRPIHMRKIFKKKQIQAKEDEKKV